MGELTVPAIAANSNGCLSTTIKNAIDNFDKKILLTSEEFLRIICY